MKVALCLMGIVGSATDKYGLGQDIDYRIGHHFIKKHILDKNDVDVFIHSWSTEFKDKLVDIYKPKKHLIERQIDFGEDTLRYHSIKSRWYSNKKVVELKSEYEKENNFKYDFVMIYRFDCMFNKDVVFSEFDNKYFYNSHVDECHKGHCHCEGMGMYADLWFFGNTDDINLFGELYDSWDKYEIEKSVLDKNKMISPHKVIVHHFKEIGLSSKVKHYFVERYDHYPVRYKFINCGYTNEEFDVNKLQEFDSIDDGRGKRGHTQDFPLDQLL
jgi:hypothetical protein